MPAHTLPARRRILSAAVAVALLFGLLGMGPAAAASGPARTVSATAAACSPAPAPMAVNAARPWPQARYDYAAIGRLSQGAGVTVAVLDSGVDPTTPQLTGAVRGGGDTIGSGNGLDDCVGHGTAVASIIAARPLPAVEFHGIAPAATILSIRVGDRVQTENGFTGEGDVAALVSGIQKAVAASPRPRVINLSISTTERNPALAAAIQAALDADIVVVAAVGNAHDPSPDAADPVPYPAAFDGVVGVGGIGEQGARQAQSQVGAYVDLVAPGEGVLTAARVAGHQTQTGTSFAAPFVAGTAALIRSRFPELSQAEVVHRLLATADPASGGPGGYGYGVVNPLRALTAVLPPPGEAGEALTPVPVVPVATPIDERHPLPSLAILASAAVLVLGAGLVTTMALATPAGRRRGWRPGKVETAPQSADDGPALFTVPGVGQRARIAVDPARPVGPRTGEYPRVARAQDPVRAAGPPPGAGPRLPLG